MSYTELITALEELVSRNPKTTEEYKSLENECWELSKFIQSNSFGNTCPSEIWHYLADADIRFKDPDYAEYQRPKFIAAIKFWSELEKTKQSI